MLTLYTPYSMLRITADQFWPLNGAFSNVWFRQVFSLCLDGGLANRRFYNGIRELLGDVLQVCVEQSVCSLYGVVDSRPVLLGRETDVFDSSVER
jgi:hypothetical protein